MASVIGPNGVETFVPDDVARSLVGNGERGYAYAPASPTPAAEPDRTKAEPRKRAPRRTVKPKEAEPHVTASPGNRR